MYTIYDTKLKITTGTYKTRSTANKAVDKKNNNYEVYRDFVRFL